jgi:hypothetical protein
MPHFLIMRHANLALLSLKGPPSLLCRAYPPLLKSMPHFLIMRHANLALLSLKGVTPNQSYMHPQSSMLCIEDWVAL